jgi:hypothetical protein
VIGHAAGPPPGALLGPEHPLVRVLEHRRLVLRWSAAVGLLLSAGIAALLAGFAVAVALVLAAGVVELVLACGVAATAVGIRARALELISAGGGNVPIAAVQRIRAWLASAAARQRLARDLEALHESAVAWNPILAGQRMTFQPRVIIAVAPDLEELAARLRAGPAELRGVALLERSLSDGCSPLYGADPEELRQHLHRIRFLLG